MVSSMSTKTTSEDIRAGNFEHDIPLELAITAHRGTSHIPERRGEQEIASYVRQLEADHRHYAEFANDETRAAFEAEFQRYRSGYAHHFRTYLQAKSRCVSTMIAGPSNFNTSRARKSSDTADKRQRELMDFRNAALRNILRIVDSASQPIRTEDEDAVARLVAKLEEAEKFQAFAVDLNATIRKGLRSSKDEAVARSWTLSNIQACLVRHHKATAKDVRAKAEEFLAPDPLGRIGIPDYRLKNNGAEIRRLKARIEEVRRAKATPDVEDYHVTTMIAIKIVHSENRVRLKFPGKPDARTRAQLKANGFRWAPSVDGGTWQSYANPTAIAYAQGIASGGAGYEGPASEVADNTRREER